ncbi:MAG: carboxypeptidase-like regulatory domain-containing protein [Polyangiaceae bacterium]
MDMNSEESVEAAIGRPVMACTPLREDLSGRVVDAATGAPIANAHVVVESWQTAPPIGGALHASRRFLGSAEARSGGNGDWRLGATSAWLEGLFGADGFPFIVNSYCVHAGGYPTFTFDPWKQPQNYVFGPVLNLALRKTEQAAALPAERGASPCGISLGPTF